MSGPMATRVLHGGSRVCAPTANLLRISLVTSTSPCPSVSASCRGPSRATRLAHRDVCTSPSRRYFSHTVPACGKGRNKKDSREANPQTPRAVAEHGDATPGRPKADPEDAFNFADLTFAFSKIDLHHEEQLKRLRTGGRFNPDFIGKVPVRPDKTSQDTYPLSELATVAHQGGRAVSILVNEPQYIKPIMSAIQSSSDFNQQPQRSEDNELELIIKIEPERPESLVQRVKETCHQWRAQIRAERQKRLKIQDKWKADKLIVPDDKKRLEKEVEKLHDKRMEYIEAKEKEALQRITTRERR